MSQPLLMQHLSAGYPMARKERVATPTSTENWARLWFDLVRHDWTSLAFVPADRHTGCLAAARALAEVARPYQGAPVEVIDAERILPAEVQGVIDALRDTAPGARMLVAVGSPLTHQAAIPVARAADASILVVRLGVSETGEARRTIDAIGGEHFFGSVTI